MEYINCGQFLVLTNLTMTSQASCNRGKRSKRVPWIDECSAFTFRTKVCKTSQFIWKQRTNNQTKL